MIFDVLQIARLLLTTRKKMNDLLAKED